MPKHTTAALVESHEDGFVGGYLAALADLDGSHTMVRTRIMFADREASAWAAFDDPMWLNPLVERHAEQERAAAVALAAQKKPVRRGTVYAVGDDRRVKIGFTAGDPHKRRRALEGAAGQRLALLGVVPDSSPADEEAVHAALDASREPVGEWFRRTPEVERWLRKVAA